ncbi:MAG: GntR family transcriptional regulator [Phycisphaerae bacterium]|nr:GntR family transcriptional regulator [Phycisphaerae bacterium]
MPSNTLRLSAPKIPRRGRPPKYPDAQKQLLHYISTHNLQPGNPLGFEKDLCEILKMSRTVLRRAILELVKEGRIISKPGLGHFVSDQNQPNEISGTILVILGARTFGSAFIQDQHLASIIMGIEHAFSRTEIQLEWSSLGPTLSPLDVYLSRCTSDTKGVIYIPLSDQVVEPIADGLHSKNAPLVIAGRPMHHEESRCVYVNHYEGMTRAIRYLTALGHRNIAYITNYSNSWVYTSRLKAYQDELTSAGVESDPQWVVSCVGGEEHVEAATRELLEKQKNLTALVVAHGSILPNVLKVLRASRKRIPDDLSVVSYDDTSAAQINHPPITVVRQPLQKIGETAARLLLKEISNHEHATATIPLEAELIVRDSVIPPRTDKGTQG